MTPDSTPPHETHTAIPAAAASSTPPNRRRKATLAAGAAIVVGGAVAAWLLWPEPLADRDPAGARACQQLADHQAGKTTANRVVVRSAVGEQAAKAATESIRAAAGNDLMADPAMAPLQRFGGPANLRFADLKKLHAACDGEGADMPPWVEGA